MEESDGTFGFQLYGDSGSYGFLDAEWASWDIQKVVNGTFKVDEGSGLQRVWNAGNDGSGSGLDADLLDGQQGSYYATASGLTSTTTTANAALPKTGGSITPSGWSAPPTHAALNIGYNGSGQTRAIDIDGGWSASESKAITFTHGSGATNILGQWDVQHNSPGSRMRWGKLYHSGDSSTYTMELVSTSTTAADLYVNGSKVIHLGNDGSGSGLDADLLDGLQLHTGRNNEANKVVRTDGSGYIQAGWINTTSGDSGLANDVVRIYCSNDAYLRYLGKSDFKVLMGLSNDTYDRRDYTSDARYHTGANSHNDVTFNGLLQRGNGFIDNWNTGAGKPPTGTHFNGFQALHFVSGTSYFHGMQMAMSAGNPSNTFLRGWWANGGSGYAWQKIWTDGNDGSGSGLDADLLDGQQGSYYYPASNPNGYTTNTGTLTATNDRIYITDTRSASRAPSYYDDRYVQADFTQSTNLGVSGGDSWAAVLTVSKWASYDPSHRQEQLIFAGTKLARRVATSDSGWSSAHTIWDSSTDGSGSGLDADLLDGQNGSYYATASGLTSTTTTANAALPKAGGTMTGNLNLSGSTNHVIIGGSTSNNAYNTVGSTTGLTFGGGNDFNNYSIGTSTQNIDGSYTKLNIKWHTGIRFFAMNRYGGVRFHSDVGMGTELMSIGNTDGHVRVANNLYANGSGLVWNANNDGAGSGLDADTVDGIQASSFLRSDTEDTTSGSLIITEDWSSGTYNGQFVIQGSYPSWETRGTSAQPYGWLHHQDSSGNYTLYSIAGYTGTSWTQRFTFKHSDQTFRNGGSSGNVYYHQGNDGSGSGLDADLLDGQQGSYYAPASTAVTLAGTQTITGNKYFLSNRNTTSNSPPLQAYSTGNTGAIMSFHRAGYYAVNMGLDSDNVFRIGGWSAATNRFVMDMSGNLTMAGNITAYSDSRLKENVEVIENALSKVQAMRGVTFTRNDVEDKEERHAGVIAQEVEVVFPEVVSENNEGIKNVAYGNMVGLLIEAVKELKQEVEDLKTQLKEK